MLEFVQQHQLASGDDVFYAGTGRWYTHNCTGFEVSPYNSSLAALAKHYEVSTTQQQHSIEAAQAGPRARGGGASLLAHIVPVNPAAVGGTPQHRFLLHPFTCCIVHSCPCFANLCLTYLARCYSLSTSRTTTCGARALVYLQSTKADWPHLLFGVPPFDHTTCNITFDYKKEAACPASDPSSLALYSKLADYAHALLGR